MGKKPKGPVPEKREYKPTLTGAFTDPKFITTDADEKRTDPYIKAETLPSRYTGMSFKVSKPKKGFGPDVYFSKKWLSLASAEQAKDGKVDEYVDEAKLWRKEAIEKKKKNIDSRDFKYASFPKKPSGSGSAIGTFQGKPFEHQPEYHVAKHGEPRSKFEAKQPPNIKTAWPKKGTYGVIGTTFGKYEAPKQADVYEQLRINERKAWEESKKKMIGNGIFKSTVRTKWSFDEKGNSGVPSAFDAYTPPEGKPKKEPKDKGPEGTKEARPPFRYASATKKGAAGCLNKFPNTRPDAGDPYDTLRLKRKEDREKGKKPIGGTWKPVSGGKAGVTRSMLKRFY